MSGRRRICILCGLRHILGGMNDPDHPHRLRRMAVGAMLLAIALGSCLVWPRKPSQAVTAPIPGALVRPAAAARVPVMFTSPATAMPAASGTKALIAGTNELDICGLTKVTVDADDSFAPYRYLNQATHKTAEQWMSALLNSDDTRARAAGLLLEGKIGQDELTGRPMDDRSRDELVALAAGASDPAVYALALSACGTYSTALGGTCQQLSVSTWARLDPDNVWPWLVLAGQAHARNDAMAESDAFDHAARAHKVDAYNDSLFAYSEPDMPGDASALERWYLTVQAIGVEAAIRAPLNSSLRHCSGSALQDDGVMARCNAIAEAMVGGATTLMDFSLGVNLGTRLGWPKQRLGQLRDQHDAMLQTLLEDSEEEKKGMWTCAAVERGNAFMRRRVQVGELEAMRELVERSGESVPEMARKEREYLDKRVLEAQRRTQDSAAVSEDAAPFQ